METGFQPSLHTKSSSKNQTKNKPKIKLEKFGTDIISFLN
jgi:hypothetical protein